MIPRPPLRFLATVVGGWVVIRIAWLLPPPPADLPTPATLFVAPALAADTVPRASNGRSESLAFASRVASWSVLARSHVARGNAAADTEPVARRLLPSDGDDRIASELLLYAVATSRPRFARAPWRGAADPGAPPSATKRFSGYAYLYARPGGGGGAVAPGGQLGASQAGVRVAYTVARRVAVAARVSTPIGDPAGSEAAAGVDYALGKAARLSIERRVALGPEGRNAWSAYAAGGFYEGVGHGLELDGYGQAGVVGARRRTLFADGAVRGGRRLSLDAERALVLGGGAWGAAQPGAARLDIGPRAALALPVGPTAATLALEGRMRVAGKARPGSGLALTLAADF